MIQSTQELVETNELRSNNLYRTGVILSFENEGEELLLRTPIETVGTIEDNYHTVKENDRIDVLAWLYYQHEVEDPSKYWWVIADANKIENPLDLTALVGVSLLVPKLRNILLQI